MLPFAIPFDDAFLVDAVFAIFAFAAMQCHLLGFSQPTP
jgi:hypothetical protein